MPELQQLTHSDLDAIQDLIAPVGPYPGERSAGRATFAWGWLDSTIGELTQFLRNESGVLDPATLADGSQAVALVSSLQSVVERLEISLSDILGRSVRVVVVDGQRRAGKFEVSERDESEVVLLVGISAELRKSAYASNCSTA